MRSLSLIAIAIAASALLTMGGTPAEAKGKVVKQGVHIYTAAGTTKRVKRAKRPTGAVRVATYRSKKEPWYGWVTNSPIAIYHEGIRYEGGTPRGPKAWYNNWEGGFNAKLFWKLHDRYAPG